MSAGAIYFGSCGCRQIGFDQFFISQGGGLTILPVCYRMRIYTGTVFNDNTYGMLYNSNVPLNRDASTPPYFETTESLGGLTPTGQPYRIEVTSTLTVPVPAAPDQRYQRAISLNFYTKFTTNEFFVGSIDHGYPNQTVVEVFQLPSQRPFRCRLVSLQGVEKDSTLMVRMRYVSAV